jgi:undecaprenyl-diphosphatase
MGARRAVRALDRWDLASSAAIGGAHFPLIVDRALPWLTRAADRSVLWIGISAALLGTGNRRARRAALRGLGSIAVTSLIANQGGKRLLPRRRPDLTQIPTRRVARRVPTSSSFPSGHSASASAFAVSVVVECPPLALPVGVLAAAVAFSRIYTGVHFPTDVITGAALGAAIAAGGAALVPVRRGLPSQSGDEPARAQRPRPSGEGVVAVVNPDSGPGGNDLATELRAALPAAQVRCVDADDDVLAVLRDAAERAEVLAVGGGDGTVCAAAQAAMDADVPLLVLPTGTFNHFAKDAGLPELDDALAALAEGRAVRVDVGDVNGLPFLNTASVGSYPEFVSRRNRWEPRFGKPLAAALAIFSVLRHVPPLEATVDGVPRRLQMFFVGNGDYQPRGFLPRGRARLDTGRLDVRFVDVSERTRPYGLMAAVLGGGLLRTSRLVESRPKQLSVDIVGEPGPLARDGELTDAPRRVRFTVRRQALTIYRNRTR